MDGRLLVVRVAEKRDDLLHGVVLRGYSVEVLVGLIAAAHERGRGGRRGDGFNLREVLPAHVAEAVNIHAAQDIA